MTRTIIVALATAALGACSFGRTEAARVVPREVPARAEEEPIAAPPAPPELVSASARVALGRRLFADPRLSRDGTVACASCHDLAHGGADDVAFSLGVGGAHGEVNAPSVFNAALNFRQFWDGRAQTLEEQINGPIENERELATSWPAVISALARDPEYVRDFGRIYTDGIRPETVRDAIATFERTLVATGSAYDRYVAGDHDALTADEAEGARLFGAYNCVNCHQGANVGGNMFERIGVMGDYFADRGHVTRADYGRFNVTGRERDRYRFKVPSLRFAVFTAPYFHDGSAATLDDAIRVMGHYQLGREIPAHDRALIAAFLGTLPGEIDHGASDAGR